MHVRKLLAVLGALFVLSISGAAISGDQQQITGTASSFNAEGVLVLDLTGARVGYYQHTIYTVHLPGNVDHVFPPSPCHGFTEVWNHLVSTGGDGTIIGRIRFSNLLALMAQHSCTVTIDVPVETVPNTLPTIDSITPN
jgi:hypothetical protein